jgi:hypothetical protein
MVTWANEGTGTSKHETIKATGQNPMKLGLLADIHEQTRQLRRAIDVLQEHGAERFVVLGDVFELGKRMEETVALLQEVQAVGVWGNHDVGLCFDPDDKICERYSAAVLGYMGSLQPRLEIDGCLFTHVEPWLDPHKIEDLWYFEGPPDSVEKLSRSFAAVPHRIMFIGHMHRWLLGTPDGLLSWRGEGSVRLDNQARYLVVVHAVWDGKCALFDTETNELVPFAGL